MSDLHEECGIAAVYHLPGKPASSLCPAQGPGEVSRLIPRMLLDLQNRGQLAAGITSYAPDRRQLIDTYKEVGSVAEVFHLSHRAMYHDLKDEFAGAAANGHVRYATVGQEDKTHAQPFERHHIKKFKWFSFAFNGQLANFEELRSRLLKDDNTYLARESDTDIFLHFLCNALAKEARQGDPDPYVICKKMAEPLDGSWCIVFLNAHGEMFVARDPIGVHPLLYAFDGSLFAAASESVALFNLGFRSDQIKNVEPGQVIIVNQEGVRFERFAEKCPSAHCFFEWAYFANVASTLDEKSVYLARKRFGEEMAIQEDIPIDEDSIVVPCPDTGKAAADGMAYKLGIPCLEGLIRNRYSGRTFIEGGEYRWRKAETKYTPLEEVLSGKRVFLVEDSIVRSTTMRVLLKRIREVGKAKEVHVRPACPPIVGPCFYGVDMSTYKELFAPPFFSRRGMPIDQWKLNREIEDEMAKDIGADSLRFLAIDAIPRAIGLPADRLCTACVNNRYPTPWGEKRAMIAFEEYDRAFKDGTLQSTAVHE
ncbi:MAG: amidophosphoribosyltransferase [Thermoguttaceae bacterium]|nr:amidophosphoribosyltransferase [Thermoguttaceae bacterium]